MSAYSLLKTIRIRCKEPNPVTESVRVKVLRVKPNILVIPVSEPYSQLVIYLDSKHVYLKK